MEVVVASGPSKLNFLVKVVATYHAMAVGHIPLGQAVFRTLQNTKRHCTQKTDFVISILRISSANHKINVNMEGSRDATWLEKTLSRVFKDNMMQSGNQNECYGGVPVICFRRDLQTVV